MFVLAALREGSSDYSFESIFVMPKDGFASGPMEIDVYLGIKGEKEKKSYFIMLGRNPRI